MSTLSMKDRSESFQRNFRVVSAEPCLRASSSVVKENSVANRFRKVWGNLVKRLANSSRVKDLMSGNTRRSYTARAAIERNKPDWRALALRFILVEMTVA